MLNENCYVVVMAGGAGTRLWPLSRREKPKHLLKLFDEKCLIELTLDKLKGQVPGDRILVLTSVKYQELTRQILAQLPPENFICEPCIRDTASAMGLAASVLQARCESATMIVLTADQIIEPPDRFNQAISHAVDFLDCYPDKLICFGLEAASPNPLVGWQRLGGSLEFAGCEVRKIIEFIEKPNIDRARQYIEEGGFCWNSGQFAWKASTILREIHTHMPESRPLLESIAAHWNTPSRDRILGELFPQMPLGSLDYRILQNTDQACSLFLPCAWADMGTHAALVDRIGKKCKDNIAWGKVLITGTGNKVLVDTEQTVVVAMDHCVVVVTDDTIFVGDRNTDMKAVVKDVAEKAPELL